MSDARDDDLRATCVGVAPLTARLEPWQRTLARQPQRLVEAVDRYGSPINVVDVTPMARNVRELKDAVPPELPFRVFFARKANKALAFVDEACRLGIGVDVASEGELAQVIERGVDPRRVVVTAAIKPERFLARCVREAVCVALDNRDEVHAAGRAAAAAGRSLRVALRIAPDLGPGRRPTRFGMTERQLASICDDDAVRDGRLVVEGVHFHVDGYRIDDRLDALTQALTAVGTLRIHGHRPSFVDIGGGIPMSYLDDPDEWQAFWRMHRRQPVTFDAHALDAVYPMWQSPTRGEWLRALLSGTVADGRTAARALIDEGLALHCEPGRALLDGCGATIGRVEFRKPYGEGLTLVGVAMNRTQCRSANDDCMIDPLLLSTGTDDGPPPAEGYLVGAYCIERELLTWRRLRFGRGVRVGDLVLVPNTAGYMMHILESASHQIPLARNLVHTGGELSLDPIDDG